MPQRMNAGNQRDGLLPVGVGIVLLGTLVLVGSLFLARADDVFYEVADNHLINYGVVGPLLAALAILGVLLCLGGMFDRSPSLSSILLLFVSAACLGLTIYASKHLGTHPTDVGYLGNEADQGTYLSIAGSSIMVAGAILAALGARRRENG